MNLLKNLKKGQALPLNTIVIAILVIIVLLVIVVFFTSSVGKTGEDINSVSLCNVDNPILAPLGYADAKPREPGKICTDNIGWKDAVGVRNCCVVKSGEVVEIDPRTGKAKE